MVDENSKEYKLEVERERCKAIKRDYFNDISNHRFYSRAEATHGFASGVKPVCAPPTGYKEGNK